MSESLMYETPVWDRFHPPIESLDERLSEAISALDTFIHAIHQRDGNRENAIEGIGATLGYGLIEDTWRVLCEARNQINKGK